MYIYKSIPVSCFVEDDFDPSSFLKLFYLSLQTTLTGFGLQHTKCLTNLMILQEFLRPTIRYTILPHKKRTKLRGRSPQANYTYRATASCRRSKCQSLRVEGVAWSAQRIPTAVNLGFLDRNLYLLIQVAPQLSSRGWVDPLQTPYFSENLVGPWIEPGTSGSVTRNCDHLTTEAVSFHIAFYIKFK
jgi:hypothetical protein